MRWSPRFGSVVAIGLAAVAVARCAPIKVDSYASRGADFARYRTYDWGPVETFATGDPRLDNNPFFQDRLKEAVEKRLAAAGFEKTPAAPQLLVHYHASVSQELNPDGADQKYGYCESCQPYVYDAGTILLDFVDTATKRLIWRGWAEGSLEGVIDDQAWMEKKIDGAVARILARFPRRL